MLSIAMSAATCSNMQAKVVLTQETCEANKLHDSEIVHILELFILIHEISIVITVDKILNSTNERTLTATTRETVDRGIGPFKLNCHFPLLQVANKDWDER